MIRRPLFKYAGSKWLLSKHYPAPRHDTIVEPFAGSACYALRHHEHQVVLVEKDPEIAALWRYLIVADPKEILSLPTSKLRVGQDIRELRISAGAKLLIRQWQRVGMSNCWTVSVWNGLPGMWADSVKEHLAEAVLQIRHWTVRCADYRSVHNRLATWFIDPPYAGLPLYGSKHMNYLELGAWCKARLGQVIVCEQQGADWLPFSPFREVVTGRRGQACSKGKSREAIFVADTR